MNYTLGQDVYSRIHSIQTGVKQRYEKPLEYKWYYIPIVLGAGALTVTYLIAKKRKKK